MKKTMMGLAACALLLSSCAKNEVLTNTADSNLISFSNLNDRLPKAANDDAQPYGVYATWNGGTTAFYMNNQEVTTDNTYTPPAYWPVSGRIMFHAYAPYLGQTGAPTIVANDTTSILLSYEITDSIQNQRDFTVATPVEVADVTTPPTTVDLSFNHMLCKVELGSVTLGTGMESFTIDTSRADYGIKVIAPVTGGTIQMIGFNKDLSNWTSLEDHTADPNKDNWHRYVGKSFFMMPQPRASDLLIQLKGIKLMQNGNLYYEGDILIRAIPSTAITNTNSVVKPIVANRFDRGSKYIVNFTLGTDIKKPGVPDEDPNPTPAPDPIIKEAIAFTSTVATWVVAPMGVSLQN